MLTIRELLKEIERLREFNPEIDDWNIEIRLSEAIGWDNYYYDGFASDVTYGGGTKVGEVLIDSMYLHIIGYID